MTQTKTLWALQYHVCEYDFDMNVISIYHMNIINRPQTKLITAPPPPLFIYFLFSDPRYSIGCMTCTLLSLLL